MLSEDKNPKFSEIKEKYSEKVEEEYKELPKEFHSVSKPWIKTVAERMETDDIVRLDDRKEKGNVVWRIHKGDNF
ncbi:MAG: hypothetical protein ABEI78_01855 [Candidatus Nanohaloarchaea archaeon]